jgi:hypothetical protein
VVSGGSVTTMVLSPHAHNFVRKAHIGLPFTSKLQPMRLDLNLPDGVATGSIKRIPELIVSFYNTLGAQYGDSTSDLYDFSEFGSTLYTGDAQADFDGGFSVEDPILIVNSSTFPMTIRSIIARVTKTGR